MMFENFQLGRVALHEVFPRRPDKTIHPPRYGSALIELAMDARDVFCKRVIDALGSAGQSMEMEIKDASPTSAVSLANQLIQSDDNTFVNVSKQFANKLASAQTALNLPGGIVIVFDGTAGYPSQHVLGVLKAETHSGFRRNATSVDFFNDLFLSPQTKLYKIGAFLIDNVKPHDDLANGWKAIVYDSLMSSANRQSAAQYFYETFLGCAIPVNSAQLTKTFFDGTKDFISKANIDPVKKNDLLTGLYTYLRVDQSPTIDLHAFSNAYFPPSIKDAYQAFMKSKNFPASAIHKDTSVITKSLKLRSVTFSKNIRLTASPEDFERSVVMEAIQGPKGTDGSIPEWTRITIKDRVSMQS